MGKKSRNKGAAGEREIAGILREWLGDQVKRRLGQARDEGHDLEGTEPFAVEVKRCETLKLMQWWKQAKISAHNADLRPALAYRQNGKPWKILVELTPEEFATIVRENVK